MPKSYARRLEENLLGLGLAAVILTLGAWGASATVLDAGASSSNGLVAEYRFDTGAGNTAYDTSGNNDGNINGASWTGGVKEGSLKFDGSDDFIETGYTEDPSEVSLSAWIKIDQSMQNNYGSIISKYRGDGSSQSYEMLSNDNGGIRFHTSGTKVDSTATLDAGRWYHVVSTWNGDAGKIYINGRLDTSDSSLSPNNNDINWEIGRSPRGDNYFNGKIDNARIYSKPLNHSQIQSLYNSGSWRIGTNTEEDDLSKVLDISFQHQNNTHVYDTSGYENHGIRENGVGQASSVDCKIGRCYSFDGKDDYVDFGDEGSLDVGDNLTISAWIENDEVASYRSLDSNGYTHSQLIGMKWAGGDTDCTSDASFSPGLIRPYNNSEYGRANWDSSSFWRVYDTGKPSVYGDYSEYMIDFDTVWGSDVSNGEAYAGSYIWSPDDRTVDISIGSDDTRKLWVNGRIAHKECDDQGLNVDDSTVKVNIEEGWNSVFAMVNEDSGGWGLQWRISDNANNLRYTADPEIVFDKKDVQISLRDGYLTGFYGNETLAENISTRGWHHAAMKGEGSSFGLYLDGKLVDSGTTTNKPSKNSVGAKSGASLGGKIDQIKVFNRSLSQSEIVEKTQGLDSGGAVLDLQFNRDGGDLAEDGSGKNNHGRLEPNEESGPSRRSGFQGGYLDFDNNDDYVEIQDSSSLDIDNSFTWSVWIKPDSIGSDSTVFGKSNAYELTLRDNDIKIVSWGDDWSPSHQLSENEWHHITVTGKADGSSRTLYVDGQKVAEGGPSYTMDQSNNPLQIGRWPDQDGSGIDGKISRLEILDYRIDQKGVKEMYQAGSTSVQSSTKALPSPVLSQTFNRIETCGRSDTITCPSGASGEIAVDESGEANHGELVSSPEVVGPEECIVGTCVRSTESSRIQDEDPSNLPESDSARTLSGWFKMTDTDKAGVFGYGNPNTNEGFQFYTPNGLGDELQFDFWGTNEGGVDDVIPSIKEKWYHVAATYDGNTITVYRNGQKIDSASYTGLNTNSERFVAGAELDRNDEFEGLYDQIKVFDRSLSEKQIWRLYAQGRDRSTSSNGPMKHFTGSSSLQSVTDRVGRDGTLGSDTSRETSDPDVASGYIGTGLEFSDADNEYVEVENPVDPTDASESMSVSFWLKPDSGTGDNALVEWSTGGGFDAHVWQFDSEDDFFFNPTGTCSSREATGVVKLDQWSHYTVLYDAPESEFRWYVDGKLVKSATESCQIDTSSDKLRLGKRVGSNDALDGKLDEVKIFPYALSEKQIREEASAGVKPGKSVYGIPNSCEEVQERSGTQVSGIRKIDPDGPGGQPPVDVYCGNSVDGGGWTLVYNYDHKGGTNPDVVEGKWPKSEGAFSHVDGISSYGFQSSDIEEVRFYCETSNHDRKVHYKTRDRDVVQGILDNSSTIGYQSVANDSAKLAGHTGFLPDAAGVPDAADVDTGEPGPSMFGPDFPMYESGKYHWSIGEPNKGGNRWECDNFPNGPQHDTLHQIWVR